MRLYPEQRCLRPLRYHRAKSPHPERQTSKLETASIPAPFPHPQGAPTEKYSLHSVYFVVTVGNRVVLCCRRQCHYRDSIKRLDGATDHEDTADIRLNP